MRVQSRKYLRDLPGVKSVGLFGQLPHRRAAQLSGFDDALFVGDRSLVSEGGTWNIATGTTTTPACVRVIAAGTPGTGS